MSEAMTHAGMLGICPVHCRIGDDGAVEAIQERHAALAPVLVVSLAVSALVCLPLGVDPLRVTGPLPAPVPARWTCQEQP